jgi:hypothetical protein
MRRAALLGTGGRLAYTEKTGEQVSVVDGRIRQVLPDPTDRDVWYEAMAGLGRWVTEEAMQALYEELGPELFMRECLCVWEPELGDSGSVIPPADWAACCDTGHRPAGGLAYALDCGETGEWTSVAASDGTHVEIVANRPGTGWVVDACVAKKAVFGVITIDPASHAGSLIAPLEKARVKVQQIKGRDHAQACVSFLDGVLNHTIRHLGQPELDTARAGVAQRTSNDAWVWSRRISTVDIAPLVAVTFAKWAADTLTTSEPLVAWR